MVDKTIYELSSIAQSGRDGENLIQHEDLWLMSAKNTDQPADFVTYKVTTQQLINGISTDIKNAISAELGLQNLAWKNYVDAETNEGITGLGNLATRDENDLRLSALAHVDYITDNDVASSKLDITKSIRGYGDLALKDTIDLSRDDNIENKLPLSKIDYRFGNLISTDQEDLNLKALAHVDIVDTRHIANKAVNFPTQVTNYEDILNELFKLLPATNSELGGIKTGYRQTGQNYPVKLNASSQAFVNVPWSDTVPDVLAATSEKLGSIKIGYKQTGKTYPVQLDNNQRAYVCVDHPDAYGLPIASDTILGGIKTQYTGKTAQTYPVKVDESGNAYVKVDWQNTDTTYASGTGIAVSNSSIALKPATSTEIGGIKVNGSVEGSYNYPVQVSNSGYAYVNISELSKFTTAATFDQIYPVGSIYISMTTTIPLTIGSWKKIGSGRCLWGAKDNNTDLGMELKAGLPSHTHKVTYHVTGCHSKHWGGIGNSHLAAADKRGTVDTAEASDLTGIYGGSTTVQPPALVVNFWQRIA